MTKGESFNFALKTSLENLVSSCKTVNSNEINKQIDKYVVSIKKFIKQNWVSE